MPSNDKAATYFSEMYFPDFNKALLIVFSFKKKREKLLIADLSFIENSPRAGGNVEKI